MTRTLARWLRRLADRLDPAGHGSEPVDISDWPEVGYVTNEGLGDALAAKDFSGVRQVVSGDDLWRRMQADRARRP